jgi:two-component system, response regulator
MEYGKCKILLVEDDADDAEMILYALRKLTSVEFIHIDDGVEALRYLFDDCNPEPTLILLDLKMPKVGGLEILQKLKSDPARKHIPVVVMISSLDGKKYVESSSLRPDSYVLKPVDCVNFLRSLTEIGIPNFQFTPTAENGRSPSLLDL